MPSNSARFIRTLSVSSSSERSWIEAGFGEYCEQIFQKALLSETLSPRR